MDVEDESIVCVACKPGYTPEYYDGGDFIIENCVEIQHCKKAALWVNGCDEPDSFAFYEIIDDDYINLTDLYYD